MISASPLLLRPPFEVVDLAERGLVPDPLLRWGIRRVCAQRLRAQRRLADAPGEPSPSSLVERGPIAVHTDAANRQHYELPADFFALVLGPHLKYSSALFEPGARSLDAAEEAMLQRTSERADLRNGQRVLELGCGWGSLTLWMAARHPDSEIVAVSNSAAQRRFIERRTAERGLQNVRVVTADINHFAPEGRFDRVVSVEMLEHLRNWKMLLSRIRQWVEDDGRLFVHVFSHARYGYPYEAEGRLDWMARHFFTGGIMPSHDLLPEVARESFALEEIWRVDGTHYSRTADAWLARLDARRDEVRPVLARTYGRDEEALWLQRWRMFFMACAEMFGFDAGQQWGVSHYRLAPRR